MLQGIHDAQLWHSTYRFIAATCAGPDRSRAQDNQDAYRFGWIGNDPILVVCDGVSASPCAAQAATLACETFMATLEQQLSSNQTPLATGLSAAVIEAHERLLSQYAPGQALCTLAAAGVCLDSQEVVFINVGDAPAYFCQEGKAELCATPDIRAQARKQNGATVIKDGMPLMDYPLTACLGDGGPCRPHILVRHVWPGAAVAVCSDGVDQRAVLEIFQAGPLQIERAVVDHVLQEAAHRTEDDATLVMLFLGEDMEVTTLNQQLLGYDRLSREQRQALLSRITQHPRRHQLDLAALAQGYRCESEEILKIGWFRLLASRLDRSQRIHEADVAAQAGYAALLRHIIASLNRG